MATVEISNNGAVLRITYTVTNNMSTSATYGTSTITINDLEAKVTGGGTFYGAKPFYQIQLLKSNGSSVGTYYAFTGNAGSSPSFTLSGTYTSFPEIAGYYTKNKAITVTRSAQSESFTFSVVNNGSTARYNHNNGSYYFNGAASFTIPDCAYASSTSIKSVGNTTTGTATTITLNTPVSSSFTHKLQYKFGSDTGYTDIATLTAGTTTYSWTPASKDFAPKLTTATSGTCTIRCITYSGSTQVGSPTTKDFTLTLKESDIQPSASASFSPVWVGTHPSELDLDPNYVQGKTKVKTNVTDISLKYGATVKSYKYEGLETTTSTTSTNTTNSFVGATSFVAKVTLTDSRGKTWSHSATIFPLSYTPPSISNAGAQRADANTVTTSATLTPAIGVSSVPGKNCPATLAITYSESGGSSSLTNNVLGTVKSPSGQNITFLENKSYVITITYTDQFGVSVSNNFSLPSKAVGMHLRKNNDGVAFGKYSEHSKTLELPDDWKIMIGQNQLSVVDTYTVTTKTHTNYNDTATRSKVPTMQFLSYWNGAYNANNASNLAYCNKGAFGTLATKDSLTAEDVGARPSTWTPTAANVGAVSGKVVWTNASPTSSFAAQTVSLTLTGYQLICVLFHRNNNATQTSASTTNSVLSAFATASLSAMVNYKEGDYTSRVFSWTTSGVKFLAGYLNGTANNNVMIPYKIIAFGGIK